MSRQPADKAHGGRAAIWQAIRKAPVFEVSALANALGIPRKTVAGYCAGLVAAGYLSGAENKVFHLDRDARETPRVRRDGSEVTQGRGTEQMWRTMQMMPVFTVDQLAVQAATETIQVRRETARSYVKHLLAAGYLIAAPKAGTGESGQVVSYRLRAAFKHTPLAPMIQRTKRVFDPNTGKIVWQEGDP